MKQFLVILSMVIIAIFFSLPVGEAQVKSAPPKEVTLTRGSLSLEFELPMPGVQLVLLSRKPLTGPATVKGLRLERFGSEILLLWNGLPSRVLRTYEVLLDGRRINVADTLDTGFLAPDRPGRYSVRALDYWGRKGKASDPVHDLENKTSSPEGVRVGDMIR